MLFLVHLPNKPRIFSTLLFKFLDFSNHLKKKYSCPGVLSNKSGESCKLLRVKDWGVQFPALSLTSYIFLGELFNHSLPKVEVIIRCLRCVTVPSVEHVTVDLRVMNSSSTLGVHLT